MIRKILKAAENSYTLQLPDDLVGKTVEIIAFEIEDVEANPSSDARLEEKLQSIKREYAKFPVKTYQYQRFDKNETHSNDEEARGRHAADFDEEPND